MTAQTVLYLKPHDHVTPALQELYRLSTTARTEYKSVPAGVQVVCQSHS